MNEAAWLREKARHDKVQALYHAEQEGISKGKIEIAGAMIADGKSISKIMSYTGLTLEEIKSCKQIMASETKAGL